MCTVMLQITNIHDVFLIKLISLNFDPGHATFKFLDDRHDVLELIRNVPDT